MRTMPQRYATWAAAALAVVAATMTWAAPAVADLPGFDVKVTQAPDTFTVGKDAHTLSAVVSTTSDRLQGRCAKVKWALVISTKGVSLDQVRVNRVENGQSVPVRARFQGEDARVVDEQLDPGQLCRNQNVTAKWTVSFTGPDNGSVNFSTQALSQRGQVLATGSASSRIVTAVANKPSKSASPSATPTFSPQPTEAVVANLPSSANADPAALAKKSSGSGVLLPGLGVGAVFVFAGVALLMRVRSRNRRAAAGGPGWHQETQTLPTGFYSMPRHRDR
ncbi:hypothetical protein ACIA5C_12750 [Actinoplanes sp. NPDC051343]|uniref:hypothetical protein n=1 Tax=Actinoplanes sp. NPDC051343 TaxID=3363906 RepID=UPI0037947649